MRAAVMTRSTTRKIEALKSEIETLRRKAETGEQWAHICLLADQVVALGGKV